MAVKLNALGFVFPTRREADEARARIAKREPELVCQLTSTKACMNENVARLIAAQTFAARANGTMLAKKAEIDLLLRLAGTTQISDAIRKAGCRERGETLMIIAGSDESVRRLLSMRKLGGRRLRSAALDPNEKMIVENGALLSALRA